MRADFAGVSVGTMTTESVDTRSTLRISTAGDVDDGKSTLLGRLLHDAGAIPADQIAALGPDPDLSRLFDGLEAEREQGITIDVAYRYLSTPQRRFIVADAPGHVQYTRNMVTAASNADLALVLVDVVKASTAGLTEQTRRHLQIAALVGVDVIAIVNKLDLVDFSQIEFESVRDAIRAAATEFGIHSLQVLPVAAKPGDNVVHRGDNLTWWNGRTLLHALGAATPRGASAVAALRLPTQRVAVITGDGGAPRRFILGQIESGSLQVGDKIYVSPSGERASIREITILGRRVDMAEAGNPVALSFDSAIDVARGDIITDGVFELSRRIEADLCWMSDRPWAVGRRLLLKQATRTTPAVIEAIGSDASTPDSGATLERNTIARVTISTRDPILADCYEDISSLGGLVLLDPTTNETAAAVFLRANVDHSSPELTVGDGI